MTGKKCGGLGAAAAVFELGDIDPAWHGWRIEGEYLRFGRDGRPAIRANELGFFEWFRWLQGDYQRQIAQLRAVGLDTAQLEALREAHAAVTACQAATARAEAVLRDALTWRARPAAAAGPGRQHGLEGGAL